MFSAEMSLRALGCVSVLPTAPRRTWGGGGEISARECAEVGRCSPAISADMSEFVRVPMECGD